jgi:hypothetical protein
MALVEGSLVPWKGEAMLRLVLLVLSILATSSNSPEAKRGSAWDPLGLENQPPPTTERGSAWDPLGHQPPPPPAGTDAGSGWDPLG